LRRPPQPDPAVPPRRLRGTPAAQGLRAAVAEGQAVARHRGRRADAHDRGPRCSRSRAGRRRRCLVTLTDSQKLAYVASQAADARANLEFETDDGMTLNIGPQHPATHGTL